MKETVKINEEQLKKVVSESVKKILKEAGFYRNGDGIVAIKDYIDEFENLLTVEKNYKEAKKIKKHIHRLLDSLAEYQECV